MGEEVKKIDLNSWARKSHYDWFSAFADPSLAMDVKMDVTEVLAYCKEKGYSSFAVVMYIICECINDNDAFRLRVLDGEIWQIDKANVAYTIMVNESRFVNCRAKMGKGFASYLADVKANQEKYAGSNYIQEEFNDLTIIDDIYCSCVPWLNFLSIHQPIPDHIPESKCIPRACWGKYYEEGGRKYMTLNITADHSLIDGLDMSNVFIAIQKGFNAPKAFLEQGE